jgi:chromosome condensin MukBEF complex kleisin-like MukF subunit
VIVRVSNEGQYRVSDDLLDRLNELDNAAVAAVEAGDEDAFHAAFEELLQVVRTEGETLGDDELEASDFILPPADLSFVEAGEEFSGEGLIPEPA